MNQHSTIPTEENPAAATSGSGEPPRSGRLHTIIIIALGILSFAVGFLLVHFIIPKAPPSAVAKDCVAADTQRASSAAESEGEAQTGGENDDANTGDEAGDDGDDPDMMSADASGGLPEVPPGATPDGVRLDGAPLYFKCWVRASDTGSSKDCDRLRVLEKRMATRLYVVNECKEQHAAEGDLGLLSLGANLNFADNTISFWSGPSSTIASAKQIGNCVRQKLAGLPLSSITHKHEKYRIFFTVNFYDIKQREQMLARMRNKGREVQVTMDKVNVREEPVDGASLGRISSDSKVIFLKKNDAKDWCQVLTPSNRIGWMICDALKL